MDKFLSLNTNLRTDANQVTALLDNVPSSFSFERKGDERYFSFSCTDDLNGHGTILISFEGPVRVFIGNTKKP